eukprot:TRINITY_DN29439_c0_g1_i1.p2 TRINITY_DN29439_c0_g1~~TRINITY_DN29439_c0_g1_i1.p2  ORF type:complete len:101 (+),score=17.06 TRINITY_DN29439_c0_g1_i1:321-623(+)
MSGTEGAAEQSSSLRECMYPARWLAPGRNSLSLGVCSPECTGSQPFSRFHEHDRGGHLPGVLWRCAGSAGFLLEAVREVLRPSGGSSRVLSDGEPGREGS